MLVEGEALRKGAAERSKEGKACAAHGPPGPEGGGRDREGFGGRREGRSRGWAVRVEA